MNHGTFCYLRTAVLALTVSMLMPIPVHAIGAAENTAWPQGATLDLNLKLTAAAGKDGSVVVQGDLVITNPTKSALTVQKLSNRLTLAFIVLDSLGNVVSPQGIAKVDPFFKTVNLNAGASMTHHLESLEFLTGSALFGYALKPGQKYRIIAVYRPAGQDGPGFTSDEAELVTPKS
jgi:hypothetical protein